MNANCRAKTVGAASASDVRAAEAIPLCGLSAGQKARIVSITGECHEVLRLHEFGLRPGVELQMLRPGQTCIIRLGAMKVCFRPKPGLSVLVESL